MSQAAARRKSTGPEASGIALNGAPSQYERWLRSVEPDSVKVDARTFTELLSFAARFGRLINFYDLHDRPDGDWTLFFLTDPTIILASIDALDLDSIEQQFRRCMKQVRGSGCGVSELDRLRDGSAFIFGMAKQVDDWFEGAARHSQSRPARLFAGEVASAIDTSLGPHLRQLTTLSHSLGLHKSGPQSALRISPPNLRAFSPVWKLTHSVSDESSSGGHDRSKDPDDAASQLEAVFQAFRSVFQRLQELARKHLPETLLEAVHKPQIAMYIAFVRLFEIAQNTLNTLTGRFSDFYYRDILREQNAGNIPDKVYLTLALDPAAGVDATSVPAGTQFPAGTEADGSAILYAADNTTAVSAARLASLRAIRVVMAPLYAQAPSSPYTFSSFDDSGSPPSNPVIAQVMGTVIDVKLMNDEAAGKGLSSGPIPWPPFGGESALDSSDIAVTSAVTLGFAIASPYLMLTGGGRDVSVSFELASGELSELNLNLETLSCATGLDFATVFEAIVEGAFDIWLSTADGWFHPDAYTCYASLQSSSPSFQLSFSLSSSAPPLVAFNPAPDAPPAAPSGPDNLNPAPELPSLKAYLRQTQVILTGVYGSVAVYPLSLLAQIGIVSIGIATQTTEMKNLAVSNSTGPVDTSSPFPVFGGIAVTGSYLQFSNEELFVKKPDSGSLCIRLGWFGLPQNETGFTGYYQGYVLGLDGHRSPDPPLFANTSFCGEMEVVNPGTWGFEATPGSPPVWSSPPNAAGLYLFRTQDNCSNAIPAPDGTLCPATGFDNLDLADAEPPSYYDPAESAIRLTLTQPDYAFGNVLYAPNVLNAAIEELPKPRGEAWVDSGCKPLADAADLLEPILASGAKPSRSDVQAAVQNSQRRLLQAAQSYLASSLAQDGAAAAAWVQQTFHVSGSTAQPYLARIIGKRLSAALKSLDQSGGFGSPPCMGEEAADPIRKSGDMLNAVVQLQQALEQAAGEPDSTYLSAVQVQLGTVQDNLRQSFQVCGTPKKKQVIYPNPPWSPQAQDLSLSYRAHCEFSPSGVEQTCGSYFYLLPFGGYQAVNSVTNGVHLLPIPDPGSLELGFTSLTAKQSLSMLAQMSAGNVETPPGVSWQYLSVNEWLPFDKAEVPVDTTNTLQNTGILTLNVPQASVEPTTVSPDNCHWLRAVTPTPNDFPGMIGLYLNPLTATWVSAAVNGKVGSGQHLSQPLPPYTIDSSVQNLAAVKTICQPIESFGGLPAENNRTFQMRVAERLRHKDRAILIWDYEQLVLERYPTVWKVQTLPATSPSGLKTPGCVLVVVVAGPQSLQVADPTEPLVSAAMVDQIQAYLVSLASPFAAIYVTNPVYVRIRVTTQVMFGASKDGGGGIDQLNAELVQYLSPWFFDAQRASTRGAYASEDAIVQFIETRPYVAAVIEIGFEYDPLPDTLAWYFLTSAKRHQIIEIDDTSGDANNSGGQRRCSQI